MPEWASANPLAMISTCSLFGYAVCNRTGNLSAELREAWHLWNYNRTTEWIDDIFKDQYFKESVGFVAQTVAAEEGLTSAEQQQLAQIV